MAKRTHEERKKDSLHKLETQRDVWVATAGVQGRAHLVPFSLSWDGEHIIVATELLSRSTENVKRSHQARLAIGETRDVLIVDAEVKIVPIAEADPSVSDAFLKRNGWDPRLAATEMVYFTMTPLSMQAWSSEEELTGRTIMRDGKWIEDGLPATK